MNSLLPVMALAALAAPLIGPRLLARTYLTDPELINLPIPKPTILIHLASVAVALLLMLQAPALGLPVISALIVSPLLALAFWTDAAGRVLPDLLTAALVVSGLTLSAFGLGLPLHRAILGIAAISIFIWCFRWFVVHRHGEEAFCLGDCKFLTACAAFLPIMQISWAIICTAPLVAVLILWRKLCPPEDPSLPFGSLFVGGLVLATSISPFLFGFSA